MATTSHPFIRCNRCQRKSYNANDIAHRYCGACHVFHDSPADFELGTTERPASPEDLQLMAVACALHLTQVELATVVKAFLECDDELVHELSRHANRPVAPLEWAQLVLSSARKALVTKEVESILQLYYAVDRRAELRRLLGQEPFVEMASKAIGVIGSEQWTAWVMRCIDVALEADDEQKGST